MARRHPRAAIRTLSILPWALLSTVCGSPLPTTTADTTVQAAPHTLSYILDWQSEEAILEDDSITLQTDLGYEVVIERGFTIAYSLQLVECDDEEEPADIPGMGQRLLNLLGPGVAWAGHSELDPNPAAIEVSQAEDILVRARVEMGRVTVEPQRYCQLHYLVARSERETVGLPDELDIVGMSVYMEGSYQRAGEASQPFVLNTSYAYGLLTDLFAPGADQDAEAALEVDTGYDDATITVTRNLDRLFDGVEFETMNTAQQAGQVLKQLVETATYSVEFGL